MNQADPLSADERDQGPEGIARRRDERRRSNAEEAARQKKMTDRLEARMRPRDWPVQASNLEPAALDPADVKAPPPPAPPSMAQLRAQAESLTVAAADPDAERARERRQRREFQEDLSREQRLFGPWTADRVDDWLVEMHTVLMRLPVETKPRGYTSGLRRTLTEFQDLVAREENRSVRSLRNVVAHRWGSLTMAQCRRSDNSMWWCARYLKDEPELAKFVGLGARWKALGAPINRRLRQLRVWPSQFYKKRARGLQLIAAGLERDKARQ